LLFCTAVAAEACQDVINTIRQGKWKAAKLWMGRATRLLLGADEAMTSTRVFDSSFYQTFLPGGACAVAKLPDVRLSNEHSFMMKTLRETERALDSARGSEEMVAANDFIETRRGFTKAMRAFIANGVIKTTNLDRVSKNLVNPSTASDSYDLAVGVLRKKKMFIEDYQFNLARSVRILRSSQHVHDVDATAHARLEECNKLMLAIVGELLDPPSYQPYA
jgi:hypothetical protein